MCPVSTKWNNRFVGRGAPITTPPAPPTIPIAGCFWRNRSDCSRVLTTSNGLVTIAPHIPPSLSSVFSQNTTMKHIIHVNTYPPATKCNHGLGFPTSFLIAACEGAEDIVLKYCLDEITVYRGYMFSGPVSQSNSGEKEG